jgi:hypothetical protein
LARLRTIVQVRHDWEADLTCLRQCHTWLLQAEALLSPQRDLPATEEAVAGWLASLERLAQAARFPLVYGKCFHHFVGVLQRLLPYLLSWTKEARLPRTNNDLERFIRALKTRYRRISGRKNWNAYLLRYGRRIAFYEDALHHRDAACLLEHRFRSLAAAYWVPARHQQCPLDLRLRTQYHFLHPRAQTLRLLEQRWSQTADGT